jgi:hypothetical protein
MDKAGDSPTLHSADIANLRIELKTAYQNALARSKKNPIAQNLATLSDPQKPLLSWFLDKWTASSNGLDQMVIESTESNVKDILNICIDEENSFPKQ